MKNCSKKLKYTLIIFYLLAILMVNYGCSNRGNFKHATEFQETPVVKEKWHWGNPEKQSNSAGYAQAVKVGNTVYISGVPSNELTPEGLASLYKSLEESLNAFGASPNDVVKETLYTVDIEKMKTLNDVRKKFYQGDYPAASWVQINRLYESNAKVEVDLIAVITDTNK
ncbi:RidA family protein [Marinicella sp. W31]|uniref:RidA family protein n=1 Tax=Marinicella sp. W31 TaxID=3023713 RepID=UPI00375702F1